MTPEHMHKYHGNMLLSLKFGCDSSLFMDPDTGRMQVIQSSSMF